MNLVSLADKVPQDTWRAICFCGPLSPELVTECMWALALHTQIQILASPLLICVTLDKILSSSEPQFLLLGGGFIASTYGA